MINLKLRSPQEFMQFSATDYRISARGLHRTQELDIAQCMSINLFFNMVQPASSFYCLFYCYRFLSQLTLTTVKPLSLMCPVP